MSETHVEKHCERCGQGILKGDGYAETDIGSGKWVHWPSCPEKEAVTPSPEKPRDTELWFTYSVVGSDLVHDRFVAEGWKPTVSIPRLEEALKTPGKGGSSSVELALEMAKRRFSPERYEFKVVKHYALHPQFPYIAFVKEKKVEEQTKIKVNALAELREIEQNLTSAASIAREKGLEQIDPMRLVGIIEGQRDRIRALISKAEGELGNPSSPKAVSKADVEAEIDVLIDNLADAIRKGGDIPAYLREALRKSFMTFKENPGLKTRELPLEQMWNAWTISARKSMLLDVKYPYADIDITVKKGWNELQDSERKAIKAAWQALPDNPHPPVSSGKFTVRFNEGTAKQEDVVLEAPSTAAATILAARKYHEKHGLYPTTAKLVTHNPDGTEAWRKRFPVMRPPF